MAYLVLVIFFVFGSFERVVHATSFGLMADADIENVDNKPAICLPVNAKEKFPVGWISLTESYVRDPGSWGLSLKDGQSPLMLKPGECIVFGEIPNGYELDNYQIKTKPLKLENNKVYVFRLNGAYEKRDTYTAVFCTSSYVKEGVEHHQYARVIDEVQVIPVCGSPSSEAIETPAETGK